MANLDKTISSFAKSTAKLTPFVTYAADSAEKNSANVRTQRCGIAKSQKKAVSAVEHLTEGNSIKGTARLTRVDPETVRRLNRKSGQHGKRFHEEKVQNVAVTNLQADERYGYVGDKQHAAWEAEVINPLSKFVISHVQGNRDESLIKQLLADAATRVAARHQVALFSDGFAIYASLFPQLFGRPYRPARQGASGRFPKIRYPIPRTAAHVQIVKHHQGRRLVSVDIRYTHGSRKRIDRALRETGFEVTNTTMGFTRFDGQ